jgi:hypothetical protein
VPSLCEEQEHANNSDNYGSRDDQESARLRTRAVRKSREVVI